MAMPPDYDTLADLFVRVGEMRDARDLHTWGTARDALAEELRELSHPVVASETGGGGCLVLDVAPDKGRAWAWGPAIDGDDREARADALMHDALTRLPPEIQRVSAFPGAGTWIDAWWRSRGATPAGLVHIYRCRGSASPSSPTHIRDLVSDDIDALTRLHEISFPNTYLSTDQMLVAHLQRKVLIADRGRGFEGYVCAERERDGTGYIHFLAVDSAQRRQGLGRDLLLGALHWLHVERAVSETSLTVADENDARRLYEKAGFELLSTGQTFDLHISSGTTSSRP